MRHERMRDERLLLHRESSSRSTKMRFQKKQEANVRSATYEGVRHMVKTEFSKKARLLG